MTEGYFFFLFDKISNFHCKSEEWNILEKITEKCHPLTLENLEPNPNTSELFPKGIFDFKIIFEAIYKKILEEIKTSSNIHGFPNHNFKLSDQFINKQRENLFYDIHKIIYNK